MKNSKAVDEVLYRIDHVIEGFCDNPDEVTFPLRYISTDDWGWGIHCARGLWVAECDADIAQEVLIEFEKRNKDK